MSNPSGSRRSGPTKIRLTILCAQSLAKKDLFYLPDPFAKIFVDGSGQYFSTDICKATLDPRWNQHYDLYIGKNDGITISVWNHRKIHKKQGGGFLGCVKILPNTIKLLKNTGYQRLDLCKAHTNDTDVIKGQIIVSLLLRGGHSGAVVDVFGDISYPDVLPDGWEERRTQSGRLYFVNRYTRTAQWIRPISRPNNDIIQTTPEPPALSNSESTSPRSNESPSNTRSGSSPHRRIQETQYNDGTPRRASSRDDSTQNTPRNMPTQNHNQQNTRGTTPPSAGRDRGISRNNDEQNANQSTNDRVNRNRNNEQLEIRQTSRHNIGTANNQSSGNTGTSRDGISNGTTPTIATNSSPTNRTCNTNSNLLSEENATVATVQTVSNLPKELMNSESLSNFKRDLVIKLKYLKIELNALQPQSGHCRLEVSRNEIFEASYRIIMKMKPYDMTKRLMVKFKGEEGLDYGGVAREWLYLLSHEMLNPQYGLFQYSGDDNYTLQINPDSGINPEHLSYFHFVGRIIGIAVFHGHHIDGGFTMPFYKMLLNKEITLSDIEGVDPELYRSLTWILENSIDGVIDATFSVEHSSFGVLKNHELIPGGKDVSVTEENKKEYVKLYVNYRFMRGIEQQFSILRKGFHELVPSHLLWPFDERELELIIGGQGTVDINDWKTHTRLKHCTPDTPVVKWFWQIVESYSEEMRARLLQFVTGSSRVPLQGFEALQGSTGATGSRLFTIHAVDAPSENLPKVHTCFNRIDIPLTYPCYQKMLDKLTQAVEETCGFALE